MKVVEGKIQTAVDGGGVPGNVHHVEGATEFAGKVDGGAVKASHKDTSKLPYDLLPSTFTYPDSVPGGSVDEMIFTLMMFGEGADGALWDLRNLLIGRIGYRDMLEGTTKVLQFGAKKYAGHNWRKGMKWSYVISAALRHLLAIKWGEEMDPETGLSHYYHVGCCLAFLSEYLCYPTLYGTLDDRFKRPA